MTDSASDNDTKFDQVVHEYYQAIESGQSVDPETFILEHAEYESQLRSFFADLNALGSLPGLSAMERTFDQNVARRNLALLPILASGDQVTYIGQYRLLEEIARGGMGVVFKARQEKLARIVALKMILSGPLASSTEIDRFLREARAAARLQHPNIVSVHEIGQHEEHYFFTMDYVESDSLADRLREGSLSAQESALLTLKISRAMSYAHQEGVLHRDLKPSNILIDSSGGPHITDFGLAKAQADADIDTLANLTVSGQILGTPSYMSPEQASGKTDLVSVQSDVYSIGAILYACLVGRAPFVGESSFHTIQQVIESFPTSPRSINSSVPLDLETICLKCLEKEPSKRYSLIELIEDLERFLAGRPVLARHISRAARAWRWSKRNPVVSSVAVAAVAILLIGCASTTYFALLFRDEARIAKFAEGQAKENAAESRRNEETAIEERERANDEAQRADEEAERAKENLRLALHEKLRFGAMLYASQLKSAHEAVSDGQSKAAWGALQATSVEFRDWEYRYVQHLLEGERTKLSVPDLKSCDLSRDGNQLYVGTSQGQLEVWDLVQGTKVRAVDAGSSPIRKVLVTKDEIRTFSEAGQLRTWDRDSLEMLDSHDVEIEAVRRAAPVAEFAQDGKRLVTGIALPMVGVERLDLWSGEGGEIQKDLYERDSNRIPYSRIATSRSGNVLALARNIAFSSESGKSLGGQVLLWDLERGEKRHNFDLDGKLVGPIACSISGRFCAASSVNTKKVLMWNVETGLQADIPLSLDQRIESLSFSPDEKNLVCTTRDLTVHLVSIETGESLKSWTGHRSAIKDILFDMSGRRLLTVGAAGNVFYSDATENRLIGPKPILSEQSRSASKNSEMQLQSSLAGLSSGGSFVATKKSDSSQEWLELMDLRSTESIYKSIGSSGVCCFSANETFFACVSTEGSIQVIDTTKSTEVAQIDTGLNAAKVDKKGIASLAISSDGKMLAIGGEAGQTELWSTAERKKLYSFPKQSERVWQLEFALDDRRLLSKAFGPHKIQMWNTSKGALVWESEIIGAQFGRLAISKDGSKFVYDTVDYADREHRGHAEFHVCEANDGQETGVLYADAGTLGDFCFNDSGDRLLALCWPGMNRITLNVWDLATGIEVAAFKTPYTPLTSEELVFTNDGNSIVTAGTIRDSSTDQECWSVHRWGEASSRPKGKFQGHVNDIVVLEFSPDGKKLISAGDDHTVRIWQVETGKLLQVFGANEPVFDACCSPDGNLVAATSGSGKLMIWTLGQPYAPTRIDFDSESILGGIAFSPDGQRIVSGARSGVVKLWDVETGALIRSLDLRLRAISSIDFSPDGKRVACSVGDRKTVIWNCNTGDIVNIIPTSAGFGAVAYSPGGEVLATSFGENGIAIIDPIEGRNLGELSGHDGRVVSLAFNSKRKHLHSASLRDQTVKTWDWSNGELLSTHRIGPVRCIAVTPDGTKIAAAVGKEIRILEIDPGKLDSNEN